MIGRLADGGGNMVAGERGEIQNGEGRGVGGRLAANNLPQNWLEVKDHQLGQSVFFDTGIALVLAAFSIDLPGRCGDTTPHCG
jgi:hypothetical protein